VAKTVEQSPKEDKKALVPSCRCFFPDHLILNFVCLKVKVDLLKLKFNPSVWKILKFGRETILVKIGFTGLCVSVQNLDPSLGFVFSRPFDFEFLKLKLKLIC
jgi:hypothetical protein